MVGKEELLLRFRVSERAPMNIDNYLIVIRAIEHRQRP